MEISSQIWKLKLAGNSGITDNPTRSGAERLPGSSRSTPSTPQHECFSVPQQITLSSNSLKLQFSGTKTNISLPEWGKHVQNISSCCPMFRFFFCLRGMWNYLGPSVKLSDRSGTCLVGIWRFFVCFVTLSFWDAQQMFSLVVFMNMQRAVSPEKRHETFTVKLTNRRYGSRHVIACCNIYTFVFKISFHIKVSCRRQLTSWHFSTKHFVFPANTSEQISFPTSDLDPAIEPRHKSLFYPLWATTFLYDQVILSLVLNIQPCDDDDDVCSATH